MSAWPRSGRTISTRDAPACTISCAPTRTSPAGRAGFRAACRDGAFGGRASSIGTRPVGSGAGSGTSVRSVAGTVCQGPSAMRARTTPCGRPSNARTSVRFSLDRLTASRRETGASATTDRLAAGPADRQPATKRVPVNAGGSATERDSTSTCTCAGGARSGAWPGETAVREQAPAIARSPAPARATSASGRLVAPALSTGAELTPISRPRPAQACGCPRRDRRPRRPPRSSSLRSLRRRSRRGRCASRAGAAGSGAAGARRTPDRSLRAR